MGWHYQNCFLSENCLHGDLNWLKQRCKLANISICRHSLVVLSVSPQKTLVLFLLWARAPQRTAKLFHSLPMRSRKRFAHYVFVAFVTHASLVHHVTETGCWAQTGSTHVCVFETFKHWFSANRTINHNFQPTGWAFDWKTAESVFHLFVCLFLLLHSYQ